METDHQALVTLLSSMGSGHRPLQLARWMTRILNYTVCVVYKKGKDNEITDCLSRLPFQCTVSETEEDNEVCLSTTCVSKQKMQNETTNFKLLNKILCSLRAFWPHRADLVDKALVFYKVRKDMTKVDGMLLRGKHVVPEKMRRKTMDLAHDSHPDMVQTQQLLRQMYWWPGLDNDVKETVRGCMICQTTDKSAKTFAAPLQPVSLPPAAWLKLGIDIVGPFEHAPLNCRFMITVVDY